MVLLHEVIDFAGFCCNWVPVLGVLAGSAGDSTRQPWLPSALGPRQSNVEQLVNRRFKRSESTSVLTTRISKPQLVVHSEWFIRDIGLSCINQCKHSLDLTSIKLVMDPKTINLIRINQVSFVSMN